MVSTVLVRVVPGSDPAAVAETIRAEVPGTKTILPAGLIGTVSSRLGSVSSLLYGSGLVVTLVTIPLLASLAAMVAHERRKETAILRALGAPRFFVRNLLIAEAVLLSLAGALAGIAIAALCLLAFQNLIAFSLKIPFTVPAAGAILAAALRALLIPVAAGGIATLWPAIRATTQDPYSVIREADP
jgi:putative ABC transport system permease protein